MPDGAGFLPSTVGEIGEDGGNNMFQMVYSQGNRNHPEAMEILHELSDGAAHLKGHGYAMSQGHPNWQHITSSTLLEIGNQLFNYPIGSMYAFFTYIYHKNQLNAGK